PPPPVSRPNDSLGTRHSARIRVVRPCQRAGAGRTVCDVSRNRSGKGSAAMSNDQVTRSGGSVAQTNGFAVGLTLFAAVMMMMVGVFQAIQGIVALFTDTFYVAGEKWVFSFDITTWGWIHLVMGIVVAVA